MIKKLLVANRGEIACRIMRTASAMQIECAAVFSDADRNALHVQLADTAFHLGPPQASASYLNSEKIIQIALEWQADAIHPGYGFLSENADFAARCKKAGLIFVGPDSKVIAAMGSKSKAKALMAAAGVPLLPGYHGDDQALETLQKEGDSLGYPLLIKAVAGGGGRGLRVVNSSHELGDALDAVKRESLAAFADDRVLLEKYLPGARHVEVQIFADQQGDCVHLYERDCSLQRRHQKLIEEAPAPGLSEEVRTALCQTAVKAAKEIGYTGAGTVEFLYQDGEYFFMEMNTRLQVEHGVTEAVCGVDLVQWQLQIAAGEPLPLKQDEITCQGWTIEARVNAESPLDDFLPGSGSISCLHWASLPDVRIDTGFRTGDRVSMYYDSLLAKVIVHAEHRDFAVARLLQTLKTSRLEGISNNLDFLCALLSDPDFTTGNVNTRLLENRLHSLKLQTQSLADARQQSSGTEVTNNSGFGTLQGWRNLVQNTYSRSFHWLQKTIPGHQQHSGESGNSDDVSALKAPLPGRIIAIMVEPGTSVSKGQTLAVMEAMKMEHRLLSPADCIVSQVSCSVDEIVQPDRVLMVFEKSDGFPS